MKRLSLVTLAAIAVLAAGSVQAHGDRDRGWGGSRHFHGHHYRGYGYPVYVAPPVRYVYRERYYAPVRVERYYQPAPIYYERPYYPRPGVTIAVPPVFIGFP